MKGKPLPGPTVCSWPDGNGELRALLYPNEVNSVFGEPESMKTWLVLLAVVQLVNDSKHVLYYDMESNDRAIVARLLALGAEPEAVAKRFHYFRPDAHITEGDHDALANGVSRVKPHLVALDGITEAYTMNELSTTAAEDAAYWFHNVSRRFLVRRPTARYSGPAVVELDHVVKSRDDRNGWAIGTQHKKAGIKGAAYEVRAVAPFGKGRHGRSRLMVAKDSPGGVLWVPFGKERARWACELHCESDADTGRITAYLETPLPDEVGGGSEPLPIAERPEFRQRMEQVWKYIKNNPSCSTRLVRNNVTGSADSVRDVLAQLEAGGYIRNDGSAHSSKWVAVRQFSAVKLSANGGDVDADN